MCDVISRELTKINHGNRCIYYYLIGTITYLHNIVLICILLFIMLLRGKNPQKGAYPLHISNDCIYACLVNRNQLLGDAVASYFISNSEILKIYIYFRFIQ